MELKHEIHRAASAVGLPFVGFATTAALPHQDQLRHWVAAGLAADMAYMARTASLRHRPAQLMPEARTAIVAALPYASAPRGGARARRIQDQPGFGAVARYARGQDYHRVLHERLRALASGIEQLVRRPIRFRVAVDTSPLHERELAAAAGLGFIGKNTMLITPGLGSYTVLGVLLVDLELFPDPPDPVRRCGRCELCLQACPTGALVRPFVLDARRCISYLTIEHRGAIPAGLRREPWVFGCDRCQEACPYNARAGQRVHGDEELQGPGQVRLADLLRLRSGEYRRLTRGRALARAPRAALVRNAALVAGEQLRTPVLAPLSGIAADLLEALRELREHPDPGIRSAARWALAGGPPARGAP